MAVAVVGGLVFQPWLLFIDVRVDDEIPAAVATAPARRVDTSRPVLSRPMTQRRRPAPPRGAGATCSPALSSATSTRPRGSARVIEHPDGSRQLAIESLETTNGPDVHVWLSAGPVVEGFDGWFTAGGYEYVDLGPIKGNLGDQLYDIPVGVDLDMFRTVDLWCVQFAVSFGAAALA